MYRKETARKTLEEATMCNNRSKAMFNALEHKPISAGAVTEVGLRLIIFPLAVAR
jgi:hypothetical protein